MFKSTIHKIAMKIANLTLSENHEIIVATTDTKALLKTIKKPAPKSSMIVEETAVQIIATKPRAKSTKNPAKANQADSSKKRGRPAKNKVEISV
jgi:hypothetical protein